MLAKVVKILFLFFFYKCCYPGSPDKKFNFPGRWLYWPKYTGSSSVKMSLSPGNTFKPHDFSVCNSYTSWGKYIQESLRNKTAVLQKPCWCIK